jgi:hypothetical protein
MFVAPIHQRTSLVTLTRAKTAKTRMDSAFPAEQHKDSDLCTILVTFQLFS